jgi:hypothetical protein
MIGTLRFLRVGGVMVGVLTSSPVDREFDPRSSQTNDNKIGICCFSSKQAALRKKNKARNQDNMSECGDMSTSGLLLQ